MGVLAKAGLVLRQVLTGVLYYMNTIEELETRYGIDKVNAQRMIDGYMGHIGEERGPLVVTDIEYIGDRTRVVTLTCKNCGRVYTSTLKSGRNKWKEVRTYCPCVTEIRHEAEREEQRKADEEKKNSLIGGEYGDYVIDRVEGDYLIGKCKECGAEKSISWRTVAGGKWKGTRCTKHTVKIKFDDSYIGRKNNMLTVIGFTRAADNRKAFVCECDCGNTTVVKPTFWEDGRIKSCGCLARSMRATPEEKRLKGIFNGMVRRCYNPNSDAYKDYGGRGIEICDEWLYNRDAFIEWALAHGHDFSLSIDRINNDGNYEPGNCRWADAKTQNSNKRPVNGGYEYNGEARTKKEISEITGVSTYYITKGINEGLSVEDAVKKGKESKGRIPDLTKDFEKKKEMHERNTYKPKGLPLPASVEQGFKLWVDQQKREKMGK